jgi:ribosomal protein L40E
MTDLPEFAEPADVDKVCQRCGYVKPGVEKRSNREWICKGCWAALNSGDPMRPRVGPITIWDE